MAAASSGKKPIMDVSKPGDTPADATSRPVIISHGPVMKDPMVNEDNSEKPEEPEITPPSVSKKVIEPVAADEPKQEEPSSDERKESTDDDKEQVKSSDKPVEKPNDDSGEKPADKASEKPKESKEDVSDTAVVDAVLDQVGDNKEQAAEDKAAEERQQLVDKLVAEKKYFVPLAAAQHRRNNRIMVIVLVAIIPLVIGILLAIDAGVIDIGVQPPFDLIK